MRALLAAMGLLAATLAAGAFDLTPEQLERGAQEIRQRGFSCPRITRIGELSDGAYRVECGRDAYRVGVIIVGTSVIPNSLSPMK